MKNVQAMELEWIHEPICINDEEIGRFKNLRFLRLYNGTFVGNLMDCFPKVRWIDCNDFDLKCELTNMCLKNLVVLNLFNIANMDDRKLWSLTKEARKLKVLSLSDCHRIIRTPDLSGCSTLEKLTFQSCHGLRKIDGSIGKLKCLIDLQFVDCPQLEGLPEEIGGLQNLEHFSLHNCYEIEGLPDSIYKWKSLRKLYLSIQGPVELSAAIQKLGNLEVLWINTDLKGQLPFEIGLLPRLQKLVLKGYYEIRELPALPTSLTHLTVSFASFHVPKLSNLTNLVELELHEDFEFDERNRRIHASDLRGIGRLSKPEQLESCLFHAHAPNELASLPKLNRLYLSGLSLQTIENCKSTALLSSNLENLSDLNIIRCQMREVKFDGLQLPNLTVLYLDGCEALEKFMLSSMRKLKKVSTNDCPKLDEIHIAGVLESLEELHIRGCVSLKRLVYVNIQWESPLESSLILASGIFNKLRKLRIGYCHKILSIQVVGTLESLEELSLFCCDHLQSLGLSNLKNLEPFNIAGDHELLIVEGLDELKFLNDLDPYDCQSLESPIDVVTSQLPNDCQLYIHNCPKLRGVKQGFEGSIRCFKNHKTSPWLEEDHDAGKQAAAPATGPATAAADLAEISRELSLQQQHVAIEGGRGDVEVGSVHFQGLGGGDQEEEDYSQAKRQRR